MMLASCKTAKKAETARHVPDIRAEQLIDSIEQSDLKCGWMSMKYDVAIKTEKIDDSFKMYIRLKQDSAIWVSATYYALEVARFLFLPDTVKYMDRKNNKYYIGSYDYIGQQFLVDVDFNSLQSIILGNGYEFAGSETEKIKAVRDGGKYFVSRLKPGQLRRALRKDEFRKSIDLVVGLVIDPHTFRVDQTSIYDFETDRKLTIDYSDFKPLCNSSFPYSIRLIAETPNEQIEVNTTVMKVSHGKPLSLSFTIPEKYEPLVP
ncbi:MAG: hypothetical protein Kow0075_04160 [Salibacteraceae bacterium]